MNHVSEHDSRRCALHREQRKRWRDTKDKRKERGDPTPLPWEPLPLDTPLGVVVLDIADRRYLRDLLTRVSNLAIPVRAAHDQRQPPAAGDVARFLRALDALAVAQAQLLDGQEPARPYRRGRGRLTPRPTDRR